MRDSRNIQTSACTLQDFLLPLPALCLLLITSGLIWAQASPQKLDSSPNSSAAELSALREALLQTQNQVALQQEEIESLNQRLSARQPVSVSTQGEVPQVIEAGLAPSVLRSGDSYAGANVTDRPVAQDEGKDNQSPLSSFKLGDAILTPGGFVDLENIFRTTNTQNNIATNFAAIPFSNTAQGQLSEFRTTAQYSRLNLKVTDKFGRNDVTAYIEGDFSGNDAANVYQSVNGQTNRLRLYFMDLKRGKWEVLGGQTWSWLTPNRNGLGPMPSDLALTYNEDQNLGVGIPYTRAAEFRIAYHASDHLAMGVGIEDPNQFIGGYVALPTAFSATLGPEFDNGAQPGAPNLFPDILSKIAYDRDVAGKHFHLEATGLLTGARATVLPVGGTSFSSHSTVGGGGDIATNFELFRNFTLLANAFWSDGGAHYLVGTGPQLVIRPNAAGTDVTPSMVHAGAGSAGFEWIATPKTAFAMYYAGDYFQRNFFPDTTNTANPTTIIGYGGPGSPNTNNRAIQQATFDWLLTFWKHPRYGALQFYTQYSYLTRAPWFVAAGEPKNAHLSMVYMGFRYVLPSTSGTLLRVPYPN
ncbi:MAG TPA: hypothetical protein VN946_11145 [Terriglobales bacterium]|jgi:hypothetical protein|nr:hypothetical protein [Terriglobales bacterium]